jgi:glutamate/tyrosine decarboxylase-like PLP-dependent enzyme
VGRFYAHDSPYTYFTSSELHLGEISLECSRAGAAAAALWLTLRLLPLRSGEGGLGAVLAACRGAALDWADLLAASEVLSVYQPPQLDIVTYYPVTVPASLAAIDEVSARIMTDGMNDADRPVFVSTLSVTADAFAQRHPEITADRDRGRILRSVLMKPESEPHVPWLHSRLEQLAR